MSEDPKKEEGAEGAEAAPAPKSKKKLFIIIGVAVLLLVGGVGFVFMSGGKQEAEKSAEEPQEEEKHYLTTELEPFIVNLSDNASFLKVRLMIEYDPAILNGAGGEGEAAAEGGGHGSGGGGKDAGGLPPQLKAREPMIRDTIIRILSSKQSSDVLSADGKETIKEELIEGINEAIGLDDQPVVNVYFLEFIVQ